MNEFDMIERYFAPLTMGNEGTAGLKDDAAVVEVPDGQELVITSDTLNEGVHFLDGEAPEHIARKALRVNLSDLAAMGAAPLCYQMNIAFPERPSDSWLEAFSNALKEDNQTFNIYCSGGDTTSIKGGRLSVSVTAMGTVPKGKDIRRTGAQAGDVIVLTGAVGDAVLGLNVLQRGLDRSQYQGAIESYRIPQPRLELAELMRECVNAAADISDGLIADCVHIARASGIGAAINLDHLEFSDEVKAALNSNQITDDEVCSAGDDYELILAVSPTRLTRALAELSKLQLKPLVIGEFKDSALGITIKKDGQSADHMIKRGWRHF